MSFLKRQGSQKFHTSFFRSINSLILSVIFSHSSPTIDFIRY